MIAPLASFLLFFPLLACAQPDLAPAQPFEPAHAVDQPKVTVETLSLELGQYRKLGQWSRKSHEAEVMKAKLERARLAYERARVLSGDKVITQKAVNLAFLKFRGLAVQVSALEYDAALEKEEAQMQKLRLLEAGSPGSNYQKEAAALAAEALRAQAAAAAGDVDLCKALRAIAQDQYDTGKRLNAQGALATAELEDRALVLKETAIQLDSAQALLQVLQKASAAFSETSSKLR